MLKGILRSFHFVCVANQDSGINQRTLWSAVLNVGDTSLLWPDPLLSSEEGDIVILVLFWDENSILSLHCGRYGGGKRIDCSQSMNSPKTVDMRAL